MTFWVLILLVALVTAGFLGFSMLRARHGEKPAAAYDLEIYREQLASVDRDLARGVIHAADAERVRTEIARRILGADAQMREKTRDQGPSRAMSVVSLGVLGLILVGGALAMYQRLGAAGYPDLPLTERIAYAAEFRETRPGQEEAERAVPEVEKPVLEESYATLLNQLRTTVTQRPDDVQGHLLLAQHETNAGNFRAGYMAQQRVIALSDQAATAEAYADLAEMMILAAGGYVSPEAEQALAQALERDPALGPARYYWGQMLAQIGRPDLAYRIWIDTARAGPPAAPWVQAIRAQLDGLAFRAGVFNPPSLSAQTAAPGPTQDDMQAAADLSPEERQEMIRGMVNNLSDRLASEGGSPEEWARLIAALGVLGETVRATAIRDEALTVFAEDAPALQMIKAAAQRAGLGQ